jgi:hypothetical protein
MSFIRAFREFWRGNRRFAALFFSFLPTPVSGPFSIIKMIKKHTMEPNFRYMDNIYFEEKVVVSVKEFV